MAEYIDREQAITKIIETYEYEFPTASGAFDEFVTRILPNVLKGIPVADVAPVRHGRWIDTGFVNSTGKIFLCSECNHNHNPNKKDVAAGRVEERPKHCPGCGARMDGGAIDGDVQ